MNAEARVQSTPAEAGLIEQFAAVKAAAEGTEKAVALRNDAFAAFEAKGLPHRRVEEWHYTDLRAKMRSAFPVSSQTSIGVLDVAKDNAYVFTIENGRVNEELSSFGDLPEGVIGRTLSKALNGNTPELLGTIATADDAAISLNTAFMQDGLVLRVNDGVELDKPIIIVYLNTADENAAYPRNLVEIGKGAKATVIERFEGTDEGTYQVNALTEAQVADNAQLTWVKVQTESANAQHLGSFAAKLGAEVQFDHFTLTSGGDLSRTQLFVTCEGEGSTVGCRGISMLGNKQHADITLVVDHAVPACDSREFYKSVIDDKAHSVFQGKIIVAPHAQKTDGQMMVQSLVLTDDAQMSVKPELEIFADDVQCAHGSTSGDIDEDLLFYLRARGIPEAQARRMLILAFLAEVIEELEDEKLVELLEGHVKSWLGAIEG